MVCHSTLVEGVDEGLVFPNGLEVLEVGPVGFHAGGIGGEL